VKKHLPYGDWTEADRKLFEESFHKSDDPFDDAAGAGAHLRPRTVRTLRYGYARWLSWISAEIPSALSDDPQHRVTPERIKSYTLALGKTMKPSSVATYVAWLLQVCCHMAPEMDWSWLKEVKNRLEATAPKRPYRAMPLDSVSLQDQGLKLMDEAETMFHQLDLADQKQVRTTAELFRDGLIIALLALTGLRRRNFQSLTLDHSIFRVGQVWAISIEASESKTKVPIDTVLPDSIGSKISCYVDHYRPMFPGAASHQGLWCAWTGRRLTDDAIYRLFKNRIAQLTGHDLTLHDARRIIATSIAIYDPANVAVASQALGHVNERVTQAHYNLARGIEASRQMASMIQSMRRRQ
jgi:integrase/recombinase XerD